MDILTQLETDLALWKPQRLGLRKLDATLSAISNLRAPKDEIAASIPGRIAFDTHFPSFCFAIATGCGKTRLMGAAIAYLYQTRGYKNFFIVTPSETIYKKTIANFTRHHPRYVLRDYVDLPDFALITGENYTRQSLVNRLIADELVIYVFNVQKIFDPRTDVVFRFHRFRETLGASFADLLRAKDDLIILMDESHRYRGLESLRAMNDLHPLLGLEFTATPSWKQNVIYEYPLGEAIEDGLVKMPVVVGRRGQTALTRDIEDIKLRDAIERHQRKKALLETYCHNEGLSLVRPLMLISGADIGHAEALKRKIDSDDFDGGQFKGKVIRTHSRMGADDADIERLVQLEEPGSEVEIVIHVNKLKEGWDVKNVYTILPLRASVSDILTEQTVGRGLRLPFGEPTGEEELDTLEIIAHERYRAIIDRANRLRQKYGYAFKTLDLDEEPSEQPVPYSIAPLARSPYEIVVPLIRPKPRTQVLWKAFSPKPSRQFVAVKVEMVGAELTKEGAERDLGLAPIVTGEDPAIYLARAILENVSLFRTSDPEHRLMVIEWVNDYLNKANPDKTQWPGVVQAHAGTMFEEIRQQIYEHFEAATRIEFQPEAEKFVSFREWKTTIPQGCTPIDKATVFDEDVVGQVISGYNKTIFPENKFHSQPEKWFADILDTDQTIERWIRLPRGQVEIFYAGSHYNPDFIAETTDVIYLIEIKRSDEVKDPIVQNKARKALDWCKAASTVSGKEWQYRLVPHDAVVKTDRFEAVISRAIRL